MFRTLVCENLSCGTSSPNMVTGCLRKAIKRINIPRQRVSKNYSSGTISPDIETACLRNLICLSCLFRSQLSIKKTPIYGTKIEFCTDCVV